MSRRAYASIRTARDECYNVYYNNIIARTVLRYVTCDYICIGVWVFLKIVARAYYAPVRPLKLFIRMIYYYTALGGACASARVETLATIPASARIVRFVRRRIQSRRVRKITIFSRSHETRMRVVVVVVSADRS